MQRTFLTIVLVLGIVISLAAPGFCQPYFQFDWAKFRDHKIEIATFELFFISTDGKLCLGTEGVTDRNLLKKGVAYNLHAFVFDGEKLKELITIPIPFRDITQMCATNDGREVLISGERGTKFVLVDVLRKKVEPLFSYRKGQPGFRTIAIIQNFGGAYYAYGYLYDKTQKRTFKGMVRLNLAKKGTPEMFEPGLDFVKATKALTIPWKSFEFASPDTLFITTHSVKDNKVNPNAFILYHWNGSQAKVIDHGLSLGGLESIDDRVFYAVRRTPAVYSLLIKDFTTKKIWKVYSGEIPFSYLYLSKGDGGRTILTTLFNFDKKNMTVYYGHEAGNFALKVVPGLDKVPFGAIRLSPDGGFYATFSPQGVVVGRVPEK